MLDRAVKESFAGRCSLGDLEKVRQYFLQNGGLRCIYCQADNPSRWDHLHAVSRGGDTVPGNLVPACQRCDDSKQDKDIEEWVAGKSKHRPDVNSFVRIQAAVKAYQDHFSYAPREFNEKLNEAQLATYDRFRRELQSLRAHLKKEGLLK
ncbi:MAG: HNH endonuclease [Thiobacillaceae bacterium]